MILLLMPSLCVASKISAATVMPWNWLNWGLSDCTCTYDPSTGSSSLPHSHPLVFSSLYPWDLSRYAFLMCLLNWARPHPTIGTAVARFWKTGCFTSPHNSVAFLEYGLSILFLQTRLPGVCKWCLPSCHSGACSPLLPMPTHQNFNHDPGSIICFIICHNQNTLKNCNPFWLVLSLALLPLKNASVRLAESVTVPDMIWDHQGDKPPGPSERKYWPLGIPLRDCVDIVNGGEAIHSKSR